MLKQLQTDLESRIMHGSMTVTMTLLVSSLKNGFSVAIAINVIDIQKYI